MISIACMECLDFWHSPLDSAKRQTQIETRQRAIIRERHLHRPITQAWGANMITAFADPFDTLFNLQRALEARTESDWLEDRTTGQGPFPPINVFQQGDEVLAIIELPGVDKNALQIQAKENTI